MLISQSSSVNEAIRLHALASPPLLRRSRTTLLCEHASEEWWQVSGSTQGDSMPRISLIAKRLFRPAISSTSVFVPSPVPLTYKPPESF